MSQGENTTTPQTTNTAVARSALLLSFVSITIINAIGTPISTIGPAVSFAPHANPADTPAIAAALTLIPSLGTPDFGELSRTGEGKGGDPPPSPLVGGGRPAVRATELGDR